MPVERSVLTAVVDRVVARFYAPETGSANEPRFVTERTLAFEARLESMGEQAEGIGDGYDERAVLSAFDHHIGEEILAALANKLILGSPPALRPTHAEISGIEQQLGTALFERLGGRDRVFAAATAEQLDEVDVEELLERQGFAAWYVDRVVTPILQPTDQQLRESFRTMAHPYRGRSFDQIREQLRAWLVIERLRVAESSLLQGLRSHARIIVTG